MRMPARLEPRGGTPASSSQSAVERLRNLARRVRRMGLAGRFDPEAAFIERDELAHGLFALAAELERAHLPAPRPVRPARPRVVASRHLAAVLAAKSREVAALQALLAQAVRPGRAQRHKGPQAQLTLPFPENRR